MVGTRRNSLEWGTQSQKKPNMVYIYLYMGFKIEQSITILHSTLPEKLKKRRTLKGTYMFPHEAEMGKISWANFEHGGEERELGQTEGEDMSGEEDSREQEYWVRGNIGSKKRNTTIEVHIINLKKYLALGKYTGIYKDDHN